MPKSVFEEIEAQFRNDAQKRAEERMALWEKSRPKRELASYILQKLTQDDKVAQHLMEEANKTSLELSKTPLNIPSPHKATINAEDFSPTGITLSSFRFTKSTSSPNIEAVSDTSGKTMSWFITTGEGIEAEWAATALFSQAQPPDGSRRMTVIAQPDIVYSYGNHAGFFGSGHTHAWIGIFVTEWDVSVSPPRQVQTNVSQQISLWELTSNDDFSDRGKPSLQAVDIPVVDNHIFVIGVQCGGDVESSGRSYARLSVSIDAIFVNFA
jgi:hypothetical protein